MLNCAGQPPRSFILTSYPLFSHGYTDHDAMTRPHFPCTAGALRASLRHAAWSRNPGPRPAAIEATKNCPNKQKCHQYFRSSMVWVEGKIEKRFPMGDAFSVRVRVVAGLR